MIRTTPFHERTSAMNETGLWEHWSGHLAASKYQVSAKFEYFAVRNSAGIFDTSPLYKYRVHGPDAERFLAGVLARDPRSARPGQAQYTIWCDDRGFIVEDGVLLRHAEDDFLLTAAEPNLAYFRDLIGRQRVTIDEVTDEHAVLAFQGPRSRDILVALAPGVAGLPYFGLASESIAGKPVTISRTGFTGDLGYEIWVQSEDALTIWDCLVQASAGQGVIPFGLTALYMLRIEAGLLLLDVDFASSRYAWTDEQRSTPFELGLGWTLKGIESDDRPFIGRRALLSEKAGNTSRWGFTGLIVDWRDYDRRYTDAGLMPPKDHTPVQEEMFVYDDEGGQVGYATSFMYSPMLQRHVALARVRPDLAKPGSHVRLEIAVNHRYEYVRAATARTPLY
ncbi:MAG TPA: aminomethyltransferase family protein, partial [Vitreimonas sp.]|nr:aminomethyltransferase family protein [Vitreimonas sp.]